MRAARDAFLAQHGFSLASYTAPRLTLHLGWAKIRVPNPGVLAWHDLHHVATGYRPDVIGEAEISIFELRGGCPSPLVRLLCAGAIACGLVRAPHRLIRAWRRARSARTLYDGATAYDTLLEMTLPQLRSHLRLQPESATKPAPPLIRNNHE